MFQCSTRPDVLHKKNVKQSASAWFWIPPIAKFGEKSALELKTIFLQYKKILLRYSEAHDDTIAILNKILWSSRQYSCNTRRYHYSVLRGSRQFSCNTRRYSCDTARLKTILLQYYKSQADTLAILHKTLWSSRQEDIRQGLTS